VCISLLEGVRARTLFATHFHELTSLEHPAISNLSMDVRDTDGQIVFLKRVKEGPSSNSYGIHVARLAGLPRETIQLAERLLKEEDARSETTDRDTARGIPGGVAPHAASTQPSSPQAQLFHPEEIVARQIEGLQIDTMTPMEALTLLARLKRELSEDKAP
jgi:DNA mismatch repair protein MutS